MLKSVMLVMIVSSYFWKTSSKRSAMTMGVPFAYAYAVVAPFNQVSPRYIILYKDVIRFFRKICEFRHIILFKPVVSKPWSINILGVRDKFPFRGSVMRKICKKTLNHVGKISLWIVLLHDTLHWKSNALFEIILKRWSVV